MQGERKRAWWGEEMKAIEMRTATVYYAPTRRRRFFSKQKAIRAEAVALIYRKYPREAFEEETGHFEDMQIKEPERFSEIVDRLSARIARKMRGVSR